MRRTLEFAYGLTTYALFFVTFSWTAVLVNVSLLSLFAVQHAIMARPAFKRRWARVVPARLERNTFVLATCLVLGLLFYVVPLDVIVSA